MKLSPVSPHTLSLLEADVEAHKRILPDSLCSMLYDVYGPWMRQRGDFWLFVGSDGFTVARLRTRDVFTVQRLDLCKAQDKGLDLGHFIERNLMLLQLRHVRLELKAAA